VKSDGTALEFVPERLKSLESCGAAIGEAGGLAYDHLPGWYVRLQAQHETDMARRPPIPQAPEVPFE